MKAQACHDETADQFRGYSIEALEEACRLDFY